MARYNREDSRTVLPQLEKELKTQIEEINKLEDGLALIGQVASIYGSASTTDITATANSHIDLGEIELDAGLWLVVSRARFTPSASGDNYTAIEFSTTSQSTGWHDRRYSGGTYSTQHSMANIVRPTSKQTYYLTGSTVTAGTWNRNNSNAYCIVAVRIA